jgi:DNA-binding XRE family transcriptional regulator
MTKQGGWEKSGFGPRLRELREAAGLTQQELAEKAGCHKQTITKLEAEAQEPAWPLVLALAKVLGVTCDAFAVAPTDTSKRNPGRPPKRPAGGDR